MKIETVVRRPWIVFLLALANVTFIIVLNAAGTRAGYFTDRQARSASIRLRSLYILKVSLHLASWVTVAFWTDSEFVGPDSDPSSSFVSQ